jgi:hypothetical protein
MAKITLDLKMVAFSWIVNPMACRMRFGKGRHKGSMSSHEPMVKLHEMEKNRLKWDENFLYKKTALC